MKPSPVKVESNNKLKGKIEGPIKEITTSTNKATGHKRTRKTGNGKGTPEVVQRTQIGVMKKKKKVVKLLGCCVVRLLGRWVVRLLGC
jgi:hypothetical protein